jgi:hypothetical protein
MEGQQKERCGHMKAAFEETKPKLCRVALILVPFQPLTPPTIPSVVILTYSLII